MEISAGIEYVPLEQGLLDQYRDCIIGAPTKMRTEEGKKPFRQPDGTWTEIGWEFKPFVEIAPNCLIRMVTEIWDWAFPGYTIEGLLLPPNFSRLMQEWNQKPRDGQLLSEVMDTCEIAFHGFPAENRDFVFLTKHYSLNEFAKKINFDQLYNLVDRHNVGWKPKK